MWLLQRFKNFVSRTITDRASRPFMAVSLDEWYHRKWPTPEEENGKDQDQS
jgi:hypothetical protein